MLDSIGFRSKFPGIFRMESPADGDMWGISPTPTQIVLDRWAQHLGSGCGGRMGGMGAAPWGAALDGWLMIIVIRMTYRSSTDIMWPWWHTFSLGNHWTSWNHEIWLLRMPRQKQSTIPGVGRSLKLWLSGQYVQQVQWLDSNLSTNPSWIVAVEPCYTYYQVILSYLLPLFSSKLSIYHHIYTYIHTYIPTYLPTYLHTYIHTYIHTVYYIYIY